jgi:hypothetical protein
MILAITIIAGCAIAVSVTPPKYTSLGTAIRHDLMRARHGLANALTAPERRLERAAERRACTRECEAAAMRVANEMTCARGKKFLKEMA